MNQFSFYETLQLNGPELPRFGVDAVGHASESTSAQQADTAIQQDLDDSSSHPRITTEDKKLLNNKLHRFLTDITFQVTLPLIEKV